MPAISVIVPVYNSVKYLQSAVDSILNQDFSDFELLLMDVACQRFYKQFLQRGKFPK